MKTLIILFTGIIISSSLMAQTIEYGYDENGNRISRRIVYLKSGKQQQNTTTDTIAQQETPEPVSLQKGSMHIQVQPNPTKGFLQVSITGTEAGTHSVKVVTMQGKSVYENAAFRSPGVVDLSDVPEGVYIMKVRSGGEEEEWKVVRE
jgi:hypothetical protein